MPHIQDIDTHLYLRRSFDLAQIHIIASEIEAITYGIVAYALYRRSITFQHLNIPCILFMTIFAEVVSKIQNIFMAVEEFIGCNWS